jgi:N-acetylmuramate 1-kinase
MPSSCDAAPPGVPPAWAAWMTSRLGTVAGATRLPVDAGRRTYYRIAAAGRTCVLAYAPVGPDRLAMPRFVEVQEVLSANGIRVPQIIAVHQELGLMLLSDLGTATVRDVLTRGASWPLTGVYRLLRQFWMIPVTGAALPRMVLGDLVAECAPLFDFYLPRRVNGPPRAELRDDVLLICAQVAAQPAAVQHRDLHARNLVCDEAGLIGVVDFQDAAHASCFLDVAAVIYDQNFTRGRDEIDRMLAESYRHLRVLPDGRAVGYPEYRRRLGAAAAYWLLRLLGVCARLVHRDGKSGFQAEIRNSLHHLSVLVASGQHGLRSAVRLLDAR